MKNLIQKYNVPGPRYTSYPTVPYWNSEVFTLNLWKDSLSTALKSRDLGDGISLYIHLPFCESLCTFCGCNKHITKRHDTETPYIKAVLKEWSLYRKLWDQKPVISEIHLGGGTPTFFSPANLRLLIQGILEDSKVTDNYAFSFEGHPNNTTREHLQTLYDLGFRRVSYGVQDYNETVQKAINRIQPFENVKRVTREAEEIGYTSVGHDIIFGLPFQTVDDIKNTIQKTAELMPGRIAFYSYAHVPWIKGNGQRGFRDEDLPSAEEKREQYEVGKRMLEDIGYTEIGMDHFALPSDALFTAMEEKTLHRNFMGYTTTLSNISIGLGVSSISDSWGAFAQNVKTVKGYYEALAQNEIPVFRGHILNQKDLIIRRHILNLMCRLETSWEVRDLYIKELPLIVNRLEEMEKDGLVIRKEHDLIVTEKGRPFVRNICMAFDLLLHQGERETNLFSMTV